MPNPGVHRFARRFRDFELHRPLGLLLHDDCASNDPLAMGDIPHAKLHEIAAAQLAVDGQVEQREVALTVEHFKANANSPNIFEFQRGFLADQFALFQGSRRPDITVGDNILNSYCVKGRSKRESHRLEGISTGR
jgi:hypothetical protein